MRRLTAKASETELHLLRRMLDLYDTSEADAYEIHDGPAEHMAACLMHLESLDRLYGDANAEGAKLLRTAIRRLEDGLAETRTLMAD